MKGVSNNRRVVHDVRRKLAERRQQLRAEFLANGKSGQVFLERTPDTTDLRQATIGAKPVLIAFARILAQTKALAVHMRATASKPDIDQSPAT